MDVLVLLLATLVFLIYNMYKANDNVKMAKY